MSKLSDKIKNTISRYGLIKKGDSLLIGVSGGPDSVALLHILKTLRAHQGLKLACVHVNHQLRAGSGRDEKFVKSLCKKWDIPCHVKRVRVRKSRQKSSIEEIAREERMTQFIQVAGRIRADAVVLAHHRDDLAETVLMRILRGTGLQGLKAIVPKRHMGATVFVRPLIDTTRQEIKKYLKENKLEFMTDITNRQTQFLRNKVRLKLLPYLEKNYNTNIRECLSNLADTSSQDYLYIEEQAKALASKILAMKNGDSVTISLEKIRKLPLSMQRALLRYAVERLKGNTRRINLTHYDQILSLLNGNTGGRKMTLPSKILASGNKKHLTLTVRKA